MLRAGQEAAELGTQAGEVKKSVPFQWDAKHGGFKGRHDPLLF